MSVRLKTIPQNTCVNPIILSLLYVVYHNAEYNLIVALFGVN